MRCLRDRSRIACPHPSGTRSVGPGRALAERRARPVDPGGARMRRRHGCDVGGGRDRARSRLRCDGNGRARVCRRARAGARPRRHHGAAPACDPRWLAAGEPRLAVGWGVPLVPRRARIGGGGQGGGTGDDVYELLNALARDAPPGAEGVLWVPALSGAMAPEWNAAARAGWFGLAAAHGRAHLARALLEGNAFALRDVLDAIRVAGHPPVEIVCVAGCARGDLLRQIRADVTGLPVTRPEDVETTARGAAMLAAAGAGLHSDVPSASRAMASPRSEPLQPRPELEQVYDELYERHRAHYAALRPLFS